MKDGDLPFTKGDAKERTEKGEEEANGDDGSSEEMKAAYNSGRLNMRSISRLAAAERS